MQQPFEDKDLHNVKLSGKDIGGYVVHLGPLN